MLNTEDLFTSARAQTGLSDFGDPSFRDGLDVLVGAWNHEAKLMPGGMARVAASTVATLVNRLKVEDYLKANPELLDALTTVYPDARLAMTHRDPGDVLGSACSLIHAVRKLYSDDVDPLECGKVLMRTFDEMIARTAAFEEANGAGSIHHIGYKPLTADPIGEMRKLYAAFDEPLTVEAEAATRETLAANPQGKHAKHEYRLEDYGLSRGQVHEHFRDYIERYDVAIRA